jgi:hypothetical protein
VDDDGDDHYRLPEVEERLSWYAKPSCPSSCTVLATVARQVTTSMYQGRFRLTSI